MRLTARPACCAAKKSRVIGMIIPKYDNRYFGSVAERFEEMARERGLLPIITCTRRRPELGDRSGKSDALLAG
ncbi:ribitol operon repressor [Klebsiella michiganensis]|nr:ribitol operon repressor [Klebsiella michiganensis]